jgi:hypothetical protein
MQPVPEFKAGKGPVPLATLVLNLNPYAAVAELSPDHELASWLA